MFDVDFECAIPHPVIRLYIVLYIVEPEDLGYEIVIAVNSDELLGMLLLSVLLPVMFNVDLQLVA